MKKVEVDKSACIACGACMSIAKDVFGPDSNGLSEVKTELVEDSNQAVVLAAESCPTGAIILTEASEEEGCECSCGCEEDCDCGCKERQECTCEK